MSPPGGPARDDEPSAYIAFESGGEAERQKTAPPPVADPVGEAWTALIAGDYDRVLALAQQQTDTGNPGFAKALAWSYIGAGNAKRAEAKSKSGADAEALLEAAAASYAKAVRIEPGAGAYNLAALAAVRGWEDECRRWLDVAKDSGALDPRHAEADPDFATVHDKPWFKQVLHAP